MAKKIFTPESLSTLISEIKTYIANAILNKADKTHVTALETALGGYKIRVLSETEYADLGTYDANTIYYCYK